MLGASQHEGQKQTTREVLLTLPTALRLQVVIGGGIIGTSVAYHLAHMGWGSEARPRPRPRPPKCDSRTRTHGQLSHL